VKDSSSENRDVSTRRTCIFSSLITGYMWICGQSLNNRKSLSIIVFQSNPNWWTKVSNFNRLFSFQLVNYVIV